MKEYELYSIPLQPDQLINILDNLEIYKDTIAINMHEINFQINSINKRIIAAFTYLRNTNLISNDIKLDFDKCTYDEKEIYLLTFLQNKMQFMSPVLKHTWLKILYSFNTMENTEIESILDNDEIKKFIENNIDYVKNVFKFLISLPIAAINYFNTEYKQFLNCNLDININDITHNESDDINFDNLIGIIYDEQFIYLITENHTNIAPEYYSKYFYTENNYRIQSIIDRLPYFQLMKLMFVGDNRDQLNSFNTNLESLLNNKK